MSLWGNSYSNHHTDLKRHLSGREIPIKTTIRCPALPQNGYCSKTKQNKPFKKVVTCQDVEKRKYLQTVVGKIAQLLYARYRGASKATAGGAGEMAQWLRALTGYSFRGGIQFPAPTWQLATACNSTFRESDTLMQTYMQAKYQYSKNILMDR